jgi:hypothetical protein
VQVRILLQQLKAILSEGYELLNRRYGACSSVEKHHNRSPSSSFVSFSNASTQLSLGKVEAAPTPTSPSSIPRKSTASPFLLLRWSFRDKKRVEAIIQNFREMNSMIHEKVKLWCLASQLGVDLQHLKHLQTDTNSKILGFDIDVTLRLTAWDAGNLPGTLELQDSLWEEILRSEKKLNDNFSTSKISDSTFIVERFPHEIDSIPSALSRSDLDGASIDPRTHTRVDALAKLLHQPKELVFRIPRCIGWRHDKLKQSIAFVFDLEKHSDCDPLDLLTLLTDSTIKISLGDKFRLALGLAKCISQLHMVHWVR